MSPETHLLVPNKHAPNNVFPVLVYRQVLPQPVTEESATTVLEKNAWTKKGTWGHIDVRHFHPNVHECYGVVPPARGTATWEDRAQTTTSMLDCIRTWVTLLVVKFNWLLLTLQNGPHWRFELGKEGMDTEAIRQEVASVPVPEEDPVKGNDGSIIEAVGEEE